ncbi:hypothetical protein ACHAW5_003740 [Stephanodiscus triporus]|uniref:Transmembrane protein n=1 Tax=Stephanodiscus triporus TaxID=2934178 RepID=A0ABD3NL04_9STRA
MTNRDDQDKVVNVSLIADVDSFTLTAVGFGLIAFNFFVLANNHPMCFGDSIIRIVNDLIKSSSTDWCYHVTPPTRDDST